MSWNRQTWDMAMIKWRSGCSEWCLLAVYVKPEESPIPAPFVRKTWLYSEIPYAILPNWTDLVIYIFLTK